MEKWDVPMNKIFLVLMTVFISGCANEFTCGQFPSSGCQPVSSVYNKTNNGVNDYRQNLFTADQKEQKQNSLITIGRAHQAINYVAPGEAILTKPLVLRVLFNSWVDKDKDLNAGGFVYLRLRDSEWLLNN